VGNDPAPERERTGDSNVYPDWGRVNGHDYINSKPDAAVRHQHKLWPAATDTLPVHTTDAHSGDGDGVHRADRDERANAHSISDEPTTADQPASSDKYAAAATDGHTRTDEYRSATANGGPAADQHRSAATDGCAAGAGYGYAAGLGLLAVSYWLLANTQEIGNCLI